MKFKLSIIFALSFTILCANRLQAQEKAFPKKGEGVTLFLKRHNRTGAAYQKQFIELNKKKLGKRETSLGWESNIRFPYKEKKLSQPPPNERTMNRCSVKNWPPIK